MDINKIKKPIYTDDRSDSHLDRPHLIQRAIINQNNTNNYKVEQNNNIQSKRFNHSDETQKKVRTNQRVVYNPKTLTSKIQTTKQLAPGEDSTDSVDPVGEFVVENAVLSPIFKAAPYIKSGIFNLINGKLRNNWIRDKIISNALNKSVNKTTLIPKEEVNNVGWFPKQTIKVSHASNTNQPLKLYFPDRWDVKNGGANPFGIWFQGKLGTARTDLTNPGKGIKAFNARQLFASRPFNYKTDLTLDKPMGTVGDVSNRAALSRKAENMGADGVIYNDVYDNGYNHNQVILSFKNPQKLTSHLQGDEAVKMFKDYGGTKIPNDSQLGQQLKLYANEARERYGLIGNKNISDDEIAQSLYKQVQELSQNSAAKTNEGEPQLLFRGDTKDYTELTPRISPNELAKKRGTMDNSLGTLFLGEYPGTYLDRYDGAGASRYLHGKVLNPITGQWEERLSGTSNTPPSRIEGYRMFFNDKRKDTPYGGDFWGFIKDKSTKESPNNLNAFIVKTPQVRDATNEISVLNDDGILLQRDKATYLGKNFKFNPNTYSMENIKTGESLGEISDGNSQEYRLAIADHYQELLNDAEKKGQGLIKSSRGTPNREEHTSYNYFALPNFNLQNAKHILPYDLRIPRDWKDSNIYRSLLPISIGLGTTNLYNKK